MYEQIPGHIRYLTANAADAMQTIAVGVVVYEAWRQLGFKDGQ
jgi:hypothetical protein